MNKDNLTFWVVGLLVGFIAGYMMHEVMASRQPPRLTPELRAQIALEGQPAQMGETPSLGAGAAPPPAAGDGAVPASGPMNQEVQALRDYVEKNPNDAEAVRRLADMNFDIRNWPRAQELYQHYLTLQPEDPGVMTDLGISFRETKQFDQALAQFQKARAIQPDHWQAYYNEVVVLAFDLRRVDEANQLLGRLQQLQPGNPEIAKLADAVAKQRNAA